MVLIVLSPLCLVVLMVVLPPFPHVPVILEGNDPVEDKVGRGAVAGSWVREEG